MNDVDPGKQYKCPAEGCEYTGLKNSVAAHYSGTKKDDAHKGGYEKAKTLMEPVSDSEGGGDSAESDDEAPELAPSEFPDSGGSDGAESNNSSGGDLDDGLSCPGCGETEELYEAEAVLRDVPDEHITPNHRGLLKRSDAVCGNCGGVFDL